jgi:hypothetical protein
MIQSEEYGEVKSSEYAERISYAMGIDSPSASVDGIKDAVIAELYELDPRARVKKTDYFNHTFAPDLVVSWKSSIDVASERYVYLRSTTDASYLIEDLQFVKANRPIIFDLSSIAEKVRTASPAATELVNASLEGNTLVTDASGLGSLIDGKRSTFLELSSTSLTQGGRGLFDQQNGASTTAALQGGFDGARNLDSNRTNAAVSVINRYLQTDFAYRLQDLLQAVWVGSGGKLEEFPGQKKVTGPISDDALQFLMAYDEIEDLDFWRRLGGRVTLNQISRLDLPDGSPNLEHFVHANLDSLWGRSVCIVDSYSRRGNADRASVAEWFTDYRLLGFRTTRFSAFFADKAQDLDTLRTRATTRHGQRGLPVELLADRASQLQVDRVELESRGRSLTYSSSDGSNLAADFELSAVSQSIGGDATVKRADVLLDSGHHLSCDFTTKFVTVRTNSRAMIRTLALVAIRMFTTITAETWDDLIAYLAPQDSKEVGQASLDLWPSHDSPA